MLTSTVPSEHCCAASPPQTASCCASFSNGWQSSSIRQPDTKESVVKSYETVRVELDEGIAWVELHRPEKRNAMNPRLNAEMVEVLLELDANDDAGVLVLAC